jgi:hypothetical protein
MIELDFYIYLFSMELRSFEKPYVALLNSANTVYNQPVGIGDSNGDSDSNHYCDCDSDGNSDGNGNGNSNGNGNIDTLQGVPV